jgi:hypothetical protein
MFKPKLFKGVDGSPCFKIRAGGSQDFGYVTIVADCAGKIKRPQSDALVPVKPGDYIIRAAHYHGQFVMIVYRVVKIVKNWFFRWAKVRYAGAFDRGEWVIQPPDELLLAIEAAKEIALSTHT